MAMAWARNKTTSEHVNLIDAIFTKERLMIIEVLKTKGKKNISELSRLTNIDRTSMTHHLGILKNYGIVTSKYEQLPSGKLKGKFGKYYELNNEKYEEAKKIVYSKLP
ncbi:MAG TPA: ArsR family transcriptional regulator [Nitrososphaerales archaeon]|nr:ArsR family transcriptional regulator [Nitrososphaerales archaeon]